MPEQTLGNWVRLSNLTGTGDKPVSVEQMWKELQARDIRVGKKRVQRLMQHHGIQARGKRKFAVTPTAHTSFPSPRIFWIAISRLTRRELVVFDSST